jgi:hypothetical protein
VSQWLQQLSSDTHLDFIHFSYSIHCLFTVSQWLRQLGSSNHLTFLFLARHSVHCLFTASQQLRQLNSGTLFKLFIHFLFNTLPAYCVAMVVTPQHRTCLYKIFKILSCLLCRNGCDTTIQSLPAPTCGPIYCVATVATSQWRVCL